MKTRMMMVTWSDGDNDSNEDYGDDVGVLPAACLRGHIAMPVSAGLLIVIGVNRGGNRIKDSGNVRISPPELVLSLEYSS